jgi:hypothetical protein
MIELGMTGAVPLLSYSNGGNTIKFLDAHRTFLISNNGSAKKG